MIRIMPRLPLAFALLLLCSPALAQSPPSEKAYIQILPDPGSPKGYKVDLTPLFEAANAGDTAAQVQLGMLSLSGQATVEKNYANAMGWFQTAAAKGHPEAHTYIGLIHVQGWGVPKDTAEGIRWLSKAIELGDPQGMCKLANLYQKGNGVPQDGAEALRLYEAAAAKGYAPAFKELFLTHREGLGGTAKSDVEAARWILRGAETGDAELQRSAGVLYMQGLGVAQDDALSFKWFRRAAIQGNGQSQNNLGVAYMGGKGVPKDTFEAYRWFSLAAIHYPPGPDRERAAKNRAAAAKALTPEQIAEADIFVHDWKPMRER